MLVSEGANNQKIAKSSSAPLYPYQVKAIAAAIWPERDQVLHERAQEEAEEEMNKLNNDPINRRRGYHRRVFRPEPFEGEVPPIMPVSHRLTVLHVY